MIRYSVHVIRKWEQQNFTNYEERNKCGIDDQSWKKAT